MTDRKLDELLLELTHVCSQAVLAETTDEKLATLRGVATMIGHIPGVKPRGDFLTMPGGARFVRFAGKNDTELLAKNKDPDPNNRHIYDIAVAYTLGSWTAMARIDDRIIFTIQDVGSRGRAEKMAVAAFHRYLKINRHGRKSANG